LFPKTEAYHTNNKKKKERQMTQKTKDSVEEQIEFADNLVSEIQINGGFDELDIAIMLDSMAMLGYVLAEAKGENLASKAYLQTITQ